MSKTTWDEGLYLKVYQGFACDRPTVFFLHYEPVLPYCIPESRTLQREKSFDPQTIIDGRFWNECVRHTKHTLGKFPQVASWNG